MENSDYLNKLEEENKRLNEYIMSLEETIKKLEEKNDSQKQMIINKTEDKFEFDYNIEATRIKKYQELRQKFYEMEINKKLLEIPNYYVIHKET